MLFLNEGYFSKSKNLVKIEEILNGCTRKDGTLNADLVRGRVGDIESLFEKQFNCSGFVLDIMPGPEKNMFTMPPTFRIYSDFFGGDPYFEKGSDGYKYTDKKSSFCFVSTTNSLVHDLSPREFIAIILHEVGHNFYQYGIISSIFWCLNFPAALGSGAARLTRQAVPKFVEKIMSKFGGVLDIFFGPNTNNVVSIFESYARFTSFLTLPQSLNGKLFKKILGEWAGERVSHENFADEFVASYGYSVDLSEALLKLNTPNIVRVMKDDHTTIVRLKTFLKIGISLSDSVNSLLDPHPETKERIDIQLKELKRIRTKEKNPKIRKMIEVDIKAVSKIRDDMHTEFSGGFFVRSLSTVGAVFSKFKKFIEFSGGDMRKLDISLKESLEESFIGAVELHKSKQPPQSKSLFL